MSGILACNGCVFHQRQCSEHRCAVLLVCVTSSVGCAAPKALASPTSKFLSPLRGFVASLSGADSTVAFRGLRTLRVLAHGYEKSRPAGGNAAARPIGSRRRDAPRHFRGRRRDAGRHNRSRRRDAARPIGSRRRDAARHFRGRRRDAGRHTRGRRRDAGGMSVIMASDTPVCRGRRLPRRPCGPTIMLPRCSPSCSKRRFHSSWRCSR